jgi:Tfp pilus assembly protein PilF
MHRATHWARQHPGDFLKLQAKKLALFWDAYEIPNNDDYYYFSHLARIFHVPVLFDFGLLGPLALLGLVLGISRRRLSFAWIAVPVVLWIVIAAFFICGRFRASATPLLAGWAGIGVGELAVCARTRSWKELWTAVGVLVAAAIAVNADIGGLRAHHSTAESHLRLGIFYSAQGDSANARREYEAAVRENPTFADGWNNLGVLHAQAQQWKDARAAFEKALALVPDHPKALGNLAALDFREGRHAEADSLARIALRVGGEEPETLYNAAVVLGNLGHIDLAYQGFHALVLRQPWNAAARAGEVRALIALGRRNDAFKSLRAHPSDRNTPELQNLERELTP